MKKILIVLFLLLGIIMCLAAPSSRLIIENQGLSTAYIDAWRYNGFVWSWTRVAAVQRGYSVPVSPVQKGDRFRANIGPDVRIYVVGQQLADSNQTYYWKLK
jgi:hypothetical protein